MIVDHIDKKIAEEVGKLRAEVTLERKSNDGEVVVLQNPPSCEPRLTLR